MTILDLERVSSEDIARRLAKYACVEISVDTSDFSIDEKKTLYKLVEAASYMNSIYWKQISNIGLALKEELSRSDPHEKSQLLRLLTINFGPWDVLDDNRPFIGSKNRPPGCNFYPSDLSKEEFVRYLEMHPSLKEEFEALTTVIKRSGEKLIAVPYEKEYQRELEAASILLNEASYFTDDSSFSVYLNAKSKDLVKGDHDSSDRLWLDLKENKFDITIGPIEVYDDQLLGLKASYEAIVLVKNFASTARMKLYERHALDLERNLPVPREYQKEEVRIDSPIEVSKLVYASGAANVGSKAIAATLPNDELVREEKGTKQIIFENVLLAKFNEILLPIANEVIAREQLGYVSGGAFLNYVLLHELSHALGLNYIRKTHSKAVKVTVRNALRDSYSTIEEAKADIIGLHNIPFFIGKNILTENEQMQAYVSYLASIFRSIRFGLASDHARANMLALSFLLAKKAVLRDVRTRKYRVEFEKMQWALDELAATLLIIEGNGNYTEAKSIITDLVRLDNITKRKLNDLEKIPVDLEFIFPPDIQALERK